MLTPQRPSALTPNLARVNNVNIDQQSMYVLIKLLFQILPSLMVTVFCLSTITGSVVYRQVVLESGMLDAHENMYMPGDRTSPDAGD